MVDILPGFREFYPEDCFYRNYLFSKIRTCCKNFGFCEYDSPILEPLELFTEKSGEEIKSQLFAFEDKGGRSVAMRPEMTPAAARMIGSKINTLKRPLKWFSIEENFRYERPQKGRLRSFYQANFDIFDEQSVAADVEIIALTINVLTSMGLNCNDFHIRLSDRILWNILLQIYNIEHITEVLAIIDRIEKDNNAIDSLKTYCNNPEDFLLTIEKLHQARSVQDIKEIFLPKLSIHAELLQDFTNRMAEFEQLISHFDNLDLLKFITIDFRIVRGLAYYTGFVFECFERHGKSRAIAGGGRYNNLIEKFGYPSTPAVGIAIGDVVLSNILYEKNLFPAYQNNSQIYILFDPNNHCYSQALQLANTLRFNGYSVNISLKSDISLNKQFKLSSNSHYLVVIKDDKIVLKDTIEKTEIQLSADNLLNAIKQMVHK